MSWFKDVPLCPLQSLLCRADTAGWRLNLSSSREAQVPLKEVLKPRLPDSVGGDFSYSWFTAFSANGLKIAMFYVRWVTDCRVFCNHCCDSIEQAHVGFKINESAGRGPRCNRPKSENHNFLCHALESTTTKTTWAEHCVALRACYKTHSWFFLCRVESKFSFMYPWEKPYFLRQWSNCMPMVSILAG